MIKNFAKNNSLFIAVLLIQMLLVTINLLFIHKYFDNLIQAGQYSVYKRFLIILVILLLCIINICIFNVLILSAYKFHKYLFYLAFFISVILWLSSTQIIIELKGLLNYDIYAQIYSLSNIGDIYLFILPITIIFLLSITLIYGVNKINFTNKNFKSIIFFNVMIAIFAYFLALNVQYPKSNRKIYLMSHRNALPIKLVSPPLSIFYANTQMKHISITKEEKQKIKYLINPKNFEHSDNKRRIIIWNIGESVVASHLTINGYKRHTTPQITNLIKNGYKINSFKRTYSIFPTSTTSHLQMFYSQALIFGADGLNFHKEQYAIAAFYKNKSVFYLLKKQGFKLYHLSTYLQYSYFREPNMTKEQNIRWNLYETDKNYQKIVSLIEKNKNDNLLILTYNYGGDSHSMYNNFNTKRFNFYTSKENSRINKYDDSIMSLDYSLAKLYKWAKNRDENIMVAYFSDHGEGIDYGLTHGYRDRKHKVPKKKGLRSADRTVLNPAAVVFFNDSWKKNINDDITFSKPFISAKRYHFERIFFDILSCSGIKEKNPWLFKVFYTQPYGICKI